MFVVRQCDNAFIYPETHDGRLFRVLVIHEVGGLFFSRLIPSHTPKQQYCRTDAHTTTKTNDLFLRRTLNAFEASNKTYIVKRKLRRCRQGVQEFQFT